MVCSKREPLFDFFLAGVAARLRGAGKEVVVSTLALVTSQREVAAIRDATANGALLEANDVACIQLLAGTPHIVGPYINVFNEGARDFPIGRGAIRIVLPVEMPATSIRIVAGAAGSVAFEMQAFGCQPLSVATRCYHARSHNLTKVHCQLVCGLDADGLTAATVDGVEILTVNSTQTLSYGNGVLIAELDSLRATGITYFRLSPQNLDMVRVAKLYRDVLDDKLGTPDALKALRSLTGDIPFVNGFLHGRAGLCWV